MRHVPCGEKIGTVPLYIEVIIARCLTRHPDRYLKGRGQQVSQSPSCQVRSGSRSSPSGAPTPPRGPKAPPPTQGLLGSSPNANLPASGTLLRSPSRPLAATGLLCALYLVGAARGACTPAAAQSTVLPPFLVPRPAALFPRRLSLLTLPSLFLTFPSATPSPPTIHPESWTLSVLGVPPADCIPVCRVESNLTPSNPLRPFLAFRLLPLSLARIQPHACRRRDSDHTRHPEPVGLDLPLPTAIPLSRYCPLLMCLALSFSQSQSQSSTSHTLLSPPTPSCARNPTQSPLPNDSGPSVAPQPALHQVLDGLRRLRLPFAAACPPEAVWQASESVSGTCTGTDAHHQNSPSDGRHLLIALEK